MNFAARQQRLARHLQWGPSRGPRRRAVERELRDLVLEELHRELGAPTQRLEPAPEATERPPRYYWQERDDE